MALALGVSLVNFISAGGQDVLEAIVKELVSASQGTLTHTRPGLAGLSSLSRPENISLRDDDLLTWFGIWFSSFSIPDGKKRAAVLNSTAL